MPCVSTIEVLVERHVGFMGDVYQMFLFQRSLDLTEGVIHIVENLVLKEYERGSARPPAPAMLSQESAVRLMDSLWKAGVRPSISAGLDTDSRKAYETLVAAKDKHISDLREIVFNRLGVEMQR
jgi:hypothetical protein